MSSHCLSAFPLHEVALGFKANTSFLLPLRSLQLLPRRMFSRVERSPALFEGTTEITEESILLFLVLACSIPEAGGRFAPMHLTWIAMPFILDAMFLLQKGFLLVYQCYPTQALCWHRPGYFQAKEPHYQVSRPFFVGNLRIHEPMPTSV